MYAAAPITALLLLVQGIEPEAADRHPAPQAVTTIVPRAGDIPDVAPILAAHCFACHGPDASARKAGLRLDRRDGAIRVSAKGRAAIVPGDPDASALMARITSQDPEERMPPADGHAALAAHEVAALRAWIAAGAPYAKHWSWRPLPEASREPSSAPAALAVGAGAAIDPQAWLRRVSFDLCGLPPTPEESERLATALQEAAASGDPHAPYRACVDALLASPRFGERWGRHWMDVVRYAETHGHEFDFQVAEAWRWRDWVIRAFNADVPYGDFVREQIAGDLLAAPRLNPADGTNESVTATGWWWMSQGTHAPVDVRLDQAERVDNQIDVATKAFLGTTASCARCHDHKFDDVSQRDYYALFGVVKSSRRAYAYQDPHGAIGSAVAQLRALRDVALAGDAAGAEWSQAAAARAPAAPAGATWTFDGGTFEGWTASGWAFGDAPLSCGDRIAPEGRAPVRMAGGCVHSGALSDALQGTLRSPTFTLPANPIRVRCHGARARVRLVIDGYFLDEREPLLFEGLIAGVDHPGEWRTVALDARRYAGEAAYLEIADDGDGFIAVDWVALGDVPADACVPAPAQLPSGAPMRTVVVPTPVRCLSMEDGTGMDSPLYVRGGAHAMGDMVPRGMIAGLRTQGDSPGAFAAGSGRLALAQEIVSPGNPLTWRVMANRVWSHLMGRGIVASTDDFGLLGQAPTDADLLDYLAVRLRAHQSVKQLIREIVLSPAYASAARPVRRLDGEALRDAMIQVAGGLDLSMGGPSIPVHLTDAMQGRGRPGASGPLDGALRRSVYLEVRRNFLSPFMQVFDQPVPTTTVGARTVSNVPAQGLALMNDPFVREQAQRWGAALAANPESAEARVRSMFLRAFARQATDAEVESATRFLGAAPDAAAWSDLAHAMLLSTEFRYLR